MSTPKKKPVSKAKPAKKPAALPIVRTLERESTAMREQIEHLGKANSMLHLDLVDAHAETAKETRRADKAEVENAALREAIKEAFKIIAVLYMDALDNHKESWPRARKWMEQWKEVAK